MQEIKLQLDKIFKKYGLSPKIEIKETEFGYCIEYIQNGFGNVTDKAYTLVTCMLNYDLFNFSIDKPTYICTIVLNFMVNAGPKTKFGVNKVLEFNKEHNNVKFFYEPNRDILMATDEIKNIRASQISLYLDILLSRIYNEEVYEFLKNLITMSFIGGIFS